MKISILKKVTIEIHDKVPEWCGVACPHVKYDTDRCALYRKVLQAYHTPSLKELWRCNECVNEFGMRESE